MKARDTNDPARLRELQWNAAIKRCQGGDAKPLRALLLARGAVPAFAREFLADLASGDAQREKGRPPSLTAAKERDLFAQVMVAWDVEAAARKARPRERAIAAVCKLHGMSADRLRGIVEKLRGEGLTRALWDQKMRPR